MKKERVGFFEPRPKGGAALLVLALLLATLVGGSHASDKPAPHGEATAAHGTPGEKATQAAQTAGRS